MASQEHEIRQPSSAATATGRPPDAMSAGAARRWPLSPLPEIRTGVHWRPGPASAWRFMTEGTGSP